MGKKNKDKTQFQAVAEYPVQFTTPTRPLCQKAEDFLQFFQSIPTEETKANYICLDRTAKLN